MNPETFLSYLKNAVPHFTFYNTVGNELFDLSFYKSADERVLSNRLTHSTLSLIVSRLNTSS